MRTLQLVSKRMYILFSIELASEGIAVDSRVYSYAIARAQLTKERPLVPDQK